jgi:3-oxoacyl-[acyl-carrier protein] reductase
MNISFNFRGKTVFVTGGRSGIGRDVVRYFLNSGATVCFTSRETLSSVETDDLRGATALQLDVSQSSGRRTLFEWVDKEGFSPDIIVNNAGHTLDVTDPFCARESWDSVFELNFFAAVEINRFFISRMNRQSPYRIINVTSCAGLENSGPVTFSAAKAALTAYTRSLGRVLAIERPNVVMMAVYPGVIETAEGHWAKVRPVDPSRASTYIRERIPAGRFGTSDEFVPLILTLAGDWNSFGHGAIMGVDGGQSRHYSYFNYL